LGVGQLRGMMVFNNMIGWSRRWRLMPRLGAFSRRPQSPPTRA